MRINQKDHTQREIKKYNWIYFLIFFLYIILISVAITFLKAIAKTKFAKISNKAEVKELAASNWISTTCRDIQTAIIKTCAYNNRFALKCAFGESYNDLYPGTIYSPPSYDVRFPSAIMSS